jgi:hypothetical protein
VTDQAPRTASQRKADTLALLSSTVVDVWVATASENPSDADARVLPHLVPVSLAWTDDERVVIAIHSASRTARDLVAHGIARLGVGPTRDVVMIDVVLEGVSEIDAAPVAVVDRYLAQADWDPRQSPGYVFAVLRPTRIQAWRESDEIPGRTLMRDGHWLV